MLNNVELAEAQRIQARLRSRMEVLEADAGLTPRARDRQRARALIEAQAGMRELGERSDARTGAEFGRAYLQAFGLSAEHSAEDRALRAELPAAWIAQYPTDFVVCDHNRVRIDRHSRSPRHNVIDDRETESRGLLFAEALADVQF
jgi:hypothetical protein